MAIEKKRAPRNKTLTLTETEKEALSRQIKYPSQSMTIENIKNKILCGDILKIVDLLPDGFVNLLIIDPPYNLSKDFNGFKFNKSDDNSYIEYLESWFPKLIRLLAPNASIYVCCDWKCSAAVYFVIGKYLKIQNRIIWQREKGRGAKSNWKNCAEDIWFATNSNDYYFDVESVKMKRKVIAPYRKDGKPKDWQESDHGNFRLTFPSNFWDDISIPYWSMPENTDHPTQKPEKLIAKLILASSRVNDFIFDPFVGSGTTAVVAKKLKRDFCGVELNKEYCCWSQERLNRADTNKEIQGYSDGVFWERNSLREQKKVKKSRSKNTRNLEVNLFEQRSYLCSTST